MPAERLVARRAAILTVAGAVKNEAEWQTVDQGKRGERAIL
jgi:hypothetical protein